MKQMKCQILAIMLLLCLFLSGCSNLKNYIYTENSLKKTAAKVLAEKYDEEFVVHDVWEKSEKQFWATCSPKDNEEVVFDSAITKDGSVIVADGYSTGIIASQIEERLEPKFQEIFGECIAQAYFFRFYDLPHFENMKQLTTNEFLQKVEIDFFSCDIFILKTESTENIQKEYTFFSEEIQKDIQEELMPDVVITLYYVDEEVFQWIKDYCEVSTHLRGEVYDTMEQYEKGYVGFIDGKINKTYEEYESLRRGNIADE